MQKLVLEKISILRNKMRRMKRVTKENSDKENVGSWVREAGPHVGRGPRVSVISSAPNGQPWS